MYIYICIHSSSFMCVFLKVFFCVCSGLGFVGRGKVVDLCGEATDSTSWHSLGSQGCHLQTINGQCTESNIILLLLAAVRGFWRPMVLHIWLIRALAK